MEKVCLDTDIGRQMWEVVNGDLYKENDARHFLDIHGAGMYDLLPTLVSGTGIILSPMDGVTLQAYSPSFDLGKELEIVDRHRRRIQTAYTLFGQYGDTLHEELHARQRTVQ